jgi:hypothetical protein
MDHRPHLSREIMAIFAMLIRIATVISVFGKKQVHADLEDEGRPGQLQRIASIRSASVGSALLRSSKMGAMNDGGPAAGEARFTVMTFGRG